MMSMCLSMARYRSRAASSVVMVVRWPFGMGTGVELGVVGGGQGYG
jgi:hypothetical protein